MELQQFRKLNVYMGTWCNTYYCYCDEQFVPMNYKLYHLRLEIYLHTSLYLLALARHIEL